MVITYVTRCAGTGLRFRNRAAHVASVTDEPYPPGGTLRVIRDAQGRVLGGPLVSEIESWEIEA